MTHNPVLSLTAFSVQQERVPRVVTLVRAATVIVPVAVVVAGGAVVVSGRGRRGRGTTTGDRLLNT